MFDPSSLSDKELLNKMKNLEAKLTQSYQFGYNEQIINQLKTLIDKCQFEFNERNYKEQYNSSDNEIKIIGED